MSRMHFYLQVYVVILMITLFSWTGTVTCRESVWTFSVDPNDNSSSLFIAANYMYAESFVNINGLCVGEKSVIEVRWMLIKIDCAENLYQPSDQTWLEVFVNPKKFAIRPYGSNASDVDDETRNDTRPALKTYFQFSTTQTVSCFEKETLIEIKDESEKPYFEATTYPGTNAQDHDEISLQEIIRMPSTQNNTNDWTSQLSYLEHVRFVPEMVWRGRLEVAKEEGAEEVQMHSRVTRVWEDGMYHFYLQITGVRGRGAIFKARGNIEMRSYNGYLSAIDWPMLPITGFMSLIYLVAGTVWIFLWARAQEHTQKIHIVIGVVAVAGALGSTLSFTDYSVRNADGIGVSGVQWIGMLISTVQISLTHLLLMVVSTGYGINRPTLSQISLVAMTILAGVSFFANSGLLIVSDESMKIKYKEPMVFTITVVVFALVNILVTGWIMAFSIYTFVYLFQRRHSSRSKLKIFSVFMSSCIIVFTTQLIMGVMAVSTGFFNDCRKDWKSEWFSSSVSRLEVFGLLVVLMWLWRPVDENRSYAFHPVSTSDRAALLEEEEDGGGDLESEKIMLEEF